MRFYAATMPASARSIKSKAGEAGIFLDFDGTLSEIVERPSDARPYEHVTDVLSSLAKVYRAVTIVSGRSSHQLVEWLGPDLDIWGVHGAERSDAGSSSVALSPVAAPFADTMKQVREEAELAVERLGIGGAIVEDKGVMIGLHYRAARDPSNARKALDDLAADLAERHRLWRGHGKLAFELRPPVELSKAEVVRQVAREKELAAAVFCGDDVVDLPGFSALDELERQGKEVLRVAVDSAEAPRELIERADVVVDGPAGALTFLRSLL